MKNQILTILILSIVLIGCSNSFQPNSINPATDCAEVKDHKVFTITANVWVNSWAFLLKEIYNEDQLVNDSSDFLLKRSFDPSEVLEYLNICEGCEGCEGGEDCSECVDCRDCTNCGDVRIYFVDLHDSPNLWLVNDLMMVNVKDCKDQLGATFLVADSSGSYYISEEQAKHAVRRKVNNDTVVNYAFIKNVYSYTFEKCTIKKQAQNALESHKKLDFEFAIHDTDPSKSTTPNIMNSKGLLAIDLLVTTPTNGQKEYTDFARPCPELCGTESPFYYLAIQSNE